MPSTLSTSVHTATPLTFCRLPKGDTLYTNGLDSVKRWDGYSSSVENAGIPRAGTTRTVTYTSFTITTTYKSWYAVQYLDDENLPGSFSTLGSFTAYSFTSIRYMGVPTSTDSRVTKRRIWRSSSGQNITLYLDKEVNDNTTTIVTSIKTDASLIISTDQRILNPDGSLAARRFGIPPADKEVVLFHQDRTFFVVDAKYTDGHLVLTQNQKTFTVVGGKLTSKMVGRKVHVKGATRAYTFNTFISTVSGVLNPAWAGSTDSFAPYSIELSTERKNIVDISEPNEPEAVPTVNGVRPQVDGAILDTQTGAMQLGSFLYILCQRHLYRWNFLADPDEDGAIFLAANRGCVNQRCQCRAEDVSYLMDRQGIYRFDGGSVDPLTFPIQDFFRLDTNPDDTKVRWERAKWFHCAYYPGEDVVRFFVCLDGSAYPRHAIAIHHRTRDLWVEQYPWQVGASVPIPIHGRHRLLLGTEREKIHLYGEGTLDGPSNPIQARLAVSSATLKTVTLPTGKWTDSDMVGCEIQICAGQGKGQTRKIVSAASSTGLVTVDSPWLTLPHGTSGTNPSTAQLCGVSWRYKTGVLRYRPDPSESYRKYTVEFDVTDNPASFDIRRYENRSKTPTNNAMAVNVSANVDGVLNTPDHEVDMKSSISVASNAPFDNDGVAWMRDDNRQDERGPTTRYVAVELRGFQNADAVTIHALRYDGAK